MKRSKEAGESMSEGGVRVDLQGALYLAFVSIEIPVEDKDRVAQPAMCYRVPFIDCDCLCRRSFYLRISVEWFHVGIGEEVPNPRDTCPGARRCRVLIQCALE